MTQNAVFNAFLNSQTKQLEMLAAESDIFDLVSVQENQFLVLFRCDGIVADQSSLFKCNEFKAVINVNPDYLSRPVNDPRQLVALMPPYPFHPNIAGPVICVGKVNAGTPLTELVHQIYEIITYQKYNPREDDALNPDGCVWARNNMDKFPIDPRPLKRRSFEDFDIETTDTQ